MIEKNKPEIVNEEKLINQEPKKEKGIVGHTLSIIREIIAIIFWIYVISKLFIFDIDIYFTQKIAPNYVWLLDYKFFILIGIIALVWLVTKQKQIITWTLYIIFYPVILVLWKFPFFVFKQKSWIFTIAVINAIISFFKSLKYTFITAASLLISFSIIFWFSNSILLWIAISIVLGILTAIYIHKFIQIFKPSSVFQVHKKIFSGIRVYIGKTYGLEENMKNLPIKDLDENQTEKWITNLQFSVLFNRVCLFSAKKLRDYQNSTINVTSYVLTIILIVALTIFSFAAINFGLYKIDSDMFMVSSPPTFYTFFYYSFKNFLFSSIQEITPFNWISQTVSMMELFFGLFIIAIFVSLLLSVKSQRYTEELNKLIKSIEEEGEEVEGFIRIEYKINSIEDALSILENLKSGMAKLLYKMTENIK